LTNEEIIKSYDESSIKGKQIQILADLNSKPTSAIAEILIKNGRMVHKRFIKEEFISDTKKPEKKEAIDITIPPQIEKILLLKIKELTAEQKALKIQIEFFEKEIEKHEETKRDIAKYIGKELDELN